MKKQSGIYKIQSFIKPEKIYIGSAVDIPKRWRAHLNGLKTKTHNNAKLQCHYNKYGEVDLQFSILLGCEKEYLIANEQFFMDSYKPWFNICPKAGSPFGRIVSAETKNNLSVSHKGNKHTSETKKKISKSHKGLNTWTTGTIRPKEIREHISDSLKRPILQYGKNGSFIKEWDSTKSASEAILVHNSCISHNLKGQRKSAGGFIWKYKEQLCN